MKKVLMTMALCAASAVPFVSEAKDNAGAQLLAQAEATQGKAEDTLKRPAFEDKRIEINLASRLLTLYQGDVGIRMYPVAPGKPDSPTPTGRRKVVDMEINPTWVDPDDPKTEVPSGPDCPLGYRWIGIGGNYGIHGTNVPSSIGGYASHGCVRMYEKDVEDLFDHIVKGIPVDIKYERVVAEMDPDKTVVYYVYPDGYGREPLEISDVRKKLAELGAGGLADDASIQQAIDSSDGQPRYVAKVYDLYLKGELLDVHAYGKDGHVYLPVMAVAKAPVSARSGRRTGTASPPPSERHPVSREGNTSISMRVMRRRFFASRGIWMRSIILYWNEKIRSERSGFFDAGE